jgi:hemolysin activation/secretion protein
VRESCRGGSGRAARRICFCIALTAIPALSLAQVAPQLSPQVSPGATQPQPLAEPLPTPTPAPLLTVPRMLDRPLGLEEGPRIVVKRFNLTGAVDHRKLGLTVAALQAKLDAAIAAQPSDGYTINQLQQIAAQLSDYYHKKSLVLARVVVPAQDVHDGVVQMRVLEGILEAVKVEGNKHNRTSTLEAPFAPLIGKPFEEDATDAALLRLTEYPGLSVFGVVTPGTAVGTSDLVLRVQREREVEFSLGLDNFGTKLAGEDRLNAGIRWNSPLGLGDLFDLYGLRSQTSGDSHAHSTYGGVDYRVPLFAGHSAVSAGYSINAYDVGSFFGIVGKVKSGDITFHQEFFRNRNGVIYGDLAVTSKDADVIYPSGAPGKERLIDVSADVGLRFSDPWHGFTDATGGYIHGSLQAPSASSPFIREGTDRSYSIFTYHLQRQQSITTYQSVVFTVGGQWTTNVLATVDQLALGGPTSARAYEVSTYVGDAGTYGSLEYLIGAPGFASRGAFGGKTWGELLKLSAFIDDAYGLTNQTVTGVPSSERLADYGLGLQFDWPGHVFARVSVARPIDAREVTTELNPKNTRFYGSLGVSF